MSTFDEFMNRLDVRNVMWLRIKYFSFIFIILFMTVYFKFDLQGLSIIITLVALLASNLYDKLTYWWDQENILKLIIEDCNFLLDKGLNNKNIEKGHIEYFRDCLINNEIPDHEMLELNLNYFLTNLGHEVNFKPTLDLKNKLKHSNDKIKLLNNYRIDKVIWNKKRKELTKDGNLYLLELLNELETKLKEINNIIKDNYNIKWKMIK